MDHERKILGQHIREVMKSQGMSAAELAKQIPCERTNIYNVFNRDSINTRLLQRICEILDYDFFQELSEALSVKMCKQGGGKNFELTHYFDKRPHYEITL